jgi:nicotinic acetylcholine receptor
MELSDLHTPTCKLHASQSFEEHSPLAERRNSDVSDIFLSPEAYKATQAVEFIAEHLRNEDEYVQVLCAVHNYASSVQSQYWQFCGMFT